MRLIFWISLVLIVYTYFGYALILLLTARLRRRPFTQDLATRTVTIIIAARNEELNLPTKLLNLERMNYPHDQMEIIVVSDGSTDQTVSILRQHSRVIPVILEHSFGKAIALNEGANRATGEILVFQDARQFVDPDAVMQLVSCFADPAVGAVSGELLLDTASSSASDALGIYWKIEKLVRRLESESGSVVGVTGAIYAIRRELFPAIPAGTLLDDVFVPMYVVRSGKRVVFQPAAIAIDKIFSEKGKEFSRKVRTLTGNYQLLRLAPWLLSPANPLLFRFISHKLLRLVAPLFLLLMLVACGVSSQPLYQTVFILQILFYLLAILGVVKPSTKRLKPIGIASTFVMLNAAATVAFYNFIAGKNRVWI